MSITRGMEALKTIRKYNEDIRKAKNSGPGAVPPVPLKKKTGKGCHVKWGWEMMLKAWLYLLWRGVCVHLFNSVMRVVKDCRKTQ